MRTSRVLAVFALRFLRSADVAAIEELARGSAAVARVSASIAFPAPVVVSEAVRSAVRHLRSRRLARPVSEPFVSSRFFALAPRGRTGRLKFIVVSRSSRVGGGSVRDKRAGAEEKVARAIEDRRARAPARFRVSLEDRCAAPDGTPALLRAGIARTAALREMLARLRRLAGNAFLVFVAAPRAAGAADI